MVEYIAMTTVKIPSIASIEIDAEEFKMTCWAKFCPKENPKYNLKTVLMMEADFKRKLPCTIIGIRPTLHGWIYDVARPRWVDGVIEQISVYEDKLQEIKDE